MPDKAWKAFERRFAKRMGTVRIGPTGDDGADFITDDFLSLIHISEPTRPY